MWLEPAPGLPKPGTRPLDTAAPPTAASWVRAASRIPASSPVTAPRLDQARPPRPPRPPCCCTPHVSRLMVQRFTVCAVFCAAVWCRRCGGCRGGEWTDNQLSAALLAASSSRGWAGCSSPGPQPAPPLRATRDTPASCTRSFGQTKPKN